MAGFAHKPSVQMDDESFPKNRKRKWMILVAAHLCFMLWDGLSKSLGVMLQSARDQFDSETWAVGFSIGLMVASRGFSGPLLRVIEVKFPYHHIAFVSGLVAGIGIVAASFTTNVVYFALCLLFPGLAFGLILNSSLVLLGQHFDELYACANGVAYSGLSVGILVFAPLSQLLLDTYGWKGALLLIGGIQCHLAVLGSLLRPVSSSSQIQHGGYSELSTQPGTCHQKERDEEYTCLEKERPRDRCKTVFRKFIEATDLDLFTEVSYLTLVVCVCNVCFVNVSWLIYSVPHILAKGLTVFDATTIVWAGGCGIFVGQIGYGLLVDFHVMKGRTLIYAANTTIGLSLMCDPLLNSTWPLIVSNFFFGVGIGILLPLTYTMMREVVGVARMTSALGWAELVGGVFRIIASFITGWFYDKSGSYDTAFILLGCMSILVIVILIMEDIGHVIQKKR